jgi:anti-anti-sigma factor
VTAAVSSHRSDDGSVFVRAVGELDADSAFQLRQAVAASLVARSDLDRPSRIVVDLGRVTTMDSPSVGVLVFCHYLAAAHHVRLVARNPLDDVHRQLYACGLADLLDLPR